MSNQQQRPQNQQSQYKCTLLKEVNQCPFYEEATGLCLKPDSDNGDNQGMSNCAFKEHINTKPKDPYVREPRWYEEFYKEKRKGKQNKQNKQSDNGKDPFPFT